MRQAPESTQNPPDSAVPGRCQPAEFLRRFRERLPAMRPEFDSKPFRPKNSSKIPGRPRGTASEALGSRASRGHPPDDQRWGRPAVGPGTSERTQGSPIHKPRGVLARGKRKRAPLGGGCQPPSPAVGFVLGQGQGGAAAAPPPGGWKTGRRSARLGCAQRIGPEEKCRAAAPKNSSGGARGGFALRKWGVGPRPESSHNRPNSAIPGRCQPPHFLRQIREKLTLMRS